MKTWAFLFFFISSSTIATLVISAPREENNAPIIGILAQESYTFDNLYPQYKSYIAASYVKYIEGSGGRVVPIKIGERKEYYEDILSKVNGVLFPGGAALFNNTDGYADAGEHIYNIVKKLNDDGEYFPLWGTCLGFELLTYLSDNRNEHRVGCSSSGQTLSLNFKPDFKTSKMFETAPSDVIQILENEAVTSNFHFYCVSEEILNENNLDDEWRTNSVNDDFNGFNFISSIESKNYPIYGTQFHPEKNIYEWVLNKNISHTRDAIRANSYFGAFFINEARRNHHKFDDKNTEDLSLIYNFPTTYTGLNGSAFEQCYFFK